MVNPLPLVAGMRLIGWCEPFWKRGGGPVLLDRCFRTEDKTRSRRLGAAAGPVLPHRYGEPASVGRWCELKRNAFSLWARWTGFWAILFGLFDLFEGWPFGKIL